MKLKLLLLCLLAGTFAVAQNPSNYPYRATRERVIAMMADSTLHAPYGTTPSVRTGGGTRPGALFFRTTDSAGYDWTGTSFYRRAYMRDTSNFLATKTDLLSAGGGDDSAFGRVDTLLASERYVNQDGNAFLWKNGKVKIRADLEPFGTRYAYNSSTVTDNTPSATATIDASGIRLQGGGDNLNNYALLEDSIAGHNLTAQGHFVATEKTSTSKMICFAFDAMGNGQNLYIFLQLADTSGYINANFSAALPTGAETNNRGVYSLKWSAGDTFLFRYTRTSYKGYITLYNTANNSSTVLDLPEVQTAVSDLRVYTIGSGSDWKVLNDFTVTYHDPKFPRFIFGGNSTWTSLTGDTEATNVMNIALDGVNDGVVDLSAASTRAADGLFLIKDFGNFRGAYVFIPWVVNDRNAGTATATYGVTLRAIRDAAIAQGGIPIFVNGVPQNSGSVVPYNDTMLTVANEVGALYIDIYTALVGTGTNMDTDYDWGDGIHLNQIGINVMGNAIRAALMKAGLLTFDSPFSIGVLPTTFRQNWEVGYDGNNLTRVVAGTNRNYLRVTPTTNIATKFTTGHAYLKGDLWTKTLAVGDAPQSGGYFSVDASGNTTAASFLTKNSTVAIGNSNLFVSGRTWQLMSTAIWQPVAQGFIIRQTTPATPNVNLIVNTTSGNAIPSNYKVATFGVNTDTSSWFDRAGGLRVEDTTSGYTIYRDWTELGDNDWVTKNLVDSIIAAGASGEANTASNVGGGNEVFKDKSGVDLRFRTLVAGSNITITQNADDIEIAASGSVSTDWNAVGSPTGDQALTFGAGESSTWTDQNTTEDLFTVNNATSTTSSLFSLNRTSTALAAGNNIMELLSSGANGTNAITAVALRTNVTNTNATSGTNYGAAFSASGATTNNAAIITGLDGTNSGRILVNNPTNSSGHTMVIKNISNTANTGILLTSNNETASMTLAWDQLRTSGNMTVAAQSGHVLITPSSGNGIALGAGITPSTAIVQVAAGTTTDAAVLYNSGTVNTTIQAGAYEYNGQHSIANVALNRMPLGGVIANSSTSVSNNTTSATTLVTYTTKANTLNATNELVEGVIDGTFGDNTGTETLTLTFAGTTIFTNAGLSGNNRSWTMNFRIVRTGASTATAYVEFFSPLETLKTTTDLTSLTFSGTNVIALTGTSSQSTTDAIVMKNYRINFTPAANN